MSRPQEFDVPQLGPAKRGESEKRVTPPVRAPQPAQARGGYLVHSLVLVLLTAASSGLAYWGYGLQQDLRSSQQQLAETTARLAEVEQLLEVTSDSAAQSGQTLRGRLEAQAAAAETKYSHFDSEIAKLWTIAYQSNKPKLEALETRLAEQADQLGALSDRQAALDKALANQTERLAPLKAQSDEQAGALASLDSRQTELDKRQSELDKRIASVSGLEAGQTALRKELDQTLDELRRSVAALDTQVRVSEEMQAERASARVADLQSSLGRLGDRIAALEKGAGTATLDRRVRVNEQAIQAIDGSRRQFNQELLQLRAQLNEMQRRLQ